MKRTGPPARKAPLSPGSKRLARTGPIAVDPEKVRARQKTARDRAAAAPPRKRATRNTGASMSVRLLAKTRDRGLCVRCGAPATNLQHREGRGAGGRGKVDAERTNGVAWLLSICGQGNTSGCHKAVDEDRVRAEREGFVIRRNGPAVDAEQVPVLTCDGWQLFLNDGTRVPCPPPPSERTAA